MWSHNLSVHTGRTTAPLVSMPMQFESELSRTFVSRHTQKKALITRNGGPAALGLLQEKPLR